MDTKQTIDTFLDFYRERGHLLVPDSGLLRPPGDPVLFTSSGMHPLTPYLEGEPHPLGRRLVGIQRCLRTTDLDEVGDPTHLTVFEMLGSWSLGDYGTTQTLRWGYELLRDGFGLTELYVTVLDGDEESLRTWQELGVPVEILGAEDNWWSNGPTGPCGPDSEIFVWTGDGPPVGTPSTNSRWVEIWNHVMMRNRRHPDGSLTLLDQSNVDTGMGLERIVSVRQGKRSVYDTDLFEPWRFLGDPLQIDHLRSSVVVIGEGVRPSNTGHGYVLRRLIRRVLTSQWRLDSGRTLSDLPDDPIDHTLHHFRLNGEVGLIRTVLGEEERKFRGLVQRGRPLVEKLRSRSGHGELTDQDLFYLHDTHGLPRELVLELLSS